jgi:hypothetical protein
VDASAWNVTQASAAIKTFLVISFPLSFKSLLKMWIEKVTIQGAYSGFIVFLTKQWGG